MDTKKTPTKKPDYQRLAEQATTAHQAMYAAASRAFLELRAVDPELAYLALNALKPEQNAASYFMLRQPGFDRDSLCAALEAGERERLMQVLRGLLHSIVM